MSKITTVGEMEVLAALDQLVLEGKLKTGFKKNGERYWVEPDVEVKE